MNDLALANPYFKRSGRKRRVRSMALIKLPLANLGLVAREQDLGHLPPLVVPRTGVDGSGEHIVLKQSESALWSSLITPERGARRRRQ